MRRGFTIVELIVVVGVVVLLLAMLVPSLVTVREQSRRVTCAGNLRQQGAAYGMYVAEFAGYLPFTHWFHQNEAFSIVQKPTLNGYTNHRYAVWVCPGFIRYGVTPTGNGGALSLQQTADHFGGGYASRLPGQRLCAELGDTDAATGGSSALVINNLNHASFVENQLCNKQGTKQTNTHYGFDQMVINKARVDIAPPESVITSEQYSLPAASNGYGYFGDRWHLGSNGNIPAGGNVLYVNGSVRWSKKLLPAAGLGFIAVVPE